MTRDELITALEAAAGPDRELDAEVWLVADPVAYNRKCSFRGMVYAGTVFSAKEKRAWTKRAAAHYAPAYTASIDAALTLVPDGDGWGIDFGPNSTFAKPDVFWWSASVGAEDAEGATPAIALCIAALKARPE